MPIDSDGDGDANFLGTRGTDQGDDNDSLESVTAFSDRIRLTLNTSFTGEDLLRTRLEAGNMTRFDDITNTNTARLGYDEDTENDIILGETFYRFPVGERLRFFVGAADIDFDDIADPVNPNFESSGTGALSRFGRRNPAIYRVGSDQGFGANIQFTDAVSLDVGYLVAGAEDSSPGGGLFNGDFSALGQLNFEPNDRLQVALSGGYSYYGEGESNLSGSTSTVQSDAPFGDLATRAYRAGLEASFKLTEQINIAGWFGYVHGEPIDDGDVEEEDAQIFNGAVNLAILDIGKEGAVLGAIFGVPPLNIDSDPDDIPYFVEAQYRFPITENILITPGAMVLINPNQNSDNDTIVVGVIRTTFRF